MDRLLEYTTKFRQDDVAPKILKIDSDIMIDLDEYVPPPTDFFALFRPAHTDELEILPGYLIGIEHTYPDGLSLYLSISLMKNA